jgi:hypothetical protein
MQNTIVNIEGKLFGTHYLPTFWDWLAKKGFKQEDVEKLTPKDKLKIILRYKWVTDDDRSAQDCEQTRKDILEKMKQLPPIDEGDKYWYKNALRLEYEINKIKGRFGLISVNELDAIEKEYNNTNKALSKENP